MDWTLISSKLHTVWAHHGLEEFAVTCGHREWIIRSLYIWRIGRHSISLI